MRLYFKIDIWKRVKKIEFLLWRLFKYLGHFSLKMEAWPMKVAKLPKKFSSVWPMFTLIPFWMVTKNTAFAKETKS